MVISKFAKAIEKRIITDDLTLLIYKCGSLIFRILPYGVSSSIAVIGAFFVFLFSPNKRKLVGENQSRACGSVSGIFGNRIQALKAYVSYARYWSEALSIGSLSRAELDGRVGFAGFEYLYEALGKGKGAIITSPHLGNWDFGAAWFASKGYPITAVMENLEPPDLLDWFAEHRIKFGVTAIPVSASVFASLTKALSRGEIVALIADRDILKSGIDLPFFGEVTSVPQGVALLALRTGAPVLPVAVYMLPGGYHFAIVDEPIYVARAGSLREDVERITKEVVSRFERFIAADPAQWHLFQPNWPSQMGN